jgi:RNA polymerase sigma-70 factor (ECF subfamily)
MASPHRERFEELYRQHRAEVWAVGYALCLNADHAWDITQEAFLRLWRQPGHGRQVGCPRRWLQQVARNLARDLLKKSFHRNGTQPPHAMDAVRARDPQPLEQLEREEAFDRLRQTLAELPAVDREILTLRYALDYSGADVAEALGLTLGAVHMRACRARQRLEESLVANGVNGVH